MAEYRGMHAYIARFPGHHLGGLALVWAYDRETARGLVVEAAATRGLKVLPEEITFSTVPAPLRPGAFVLEDGDY
jgi:hypothetical protein